MKKCNATEQGKNTEEKNERTERSDTNFFFSFFVFPSGLWKIPRNSQNICSYYMLNHWVEHILTDLTKHRRRSGTFVVL